MKTRYSHESLDVDESNVNFFRIGTRKQVAMTEVEITGSNNNAPNSGCVRRKLFASERALYAMHFWSKGSLEALFLEHGVSSNAMIDQRQYFGCSSTVPSDVKFFVYLDSYSSFRAISELQVA